MTNEIKEVKNRLDKLEFPDFDPETTLVFTGIKPSLYERDSEVI